MSEAITITEDDMEFDFTTDDQAGACPSCGVDLEFAEQMFTSPDGPEYCPLCKEKI